MEIRAICAKPDGVWVGSQPSIPRGRTIWITDAHFGDGKRFVVHSDEKLTAFVELEAATRAGTAIATRHYVLDSREGPGFIEQSRAF